MTQPLMDAFLSGDIRTLSRLITRIENDPIGEKELLARLYSHRHGSPILGITGPPGAGKSTLVDKIVHLLRKEGKKVGVLAIDPSSPFSGGAILGDRIRMQDHAGDEGVYVRSVGTRGAHGGLSRAARNIVTVLDAYGFDQIIIETVGVGQTELDIMEIADTTVVVMVPEAGDTVQTLKAGLLEIADIFMVNKADRPAALVMVQALKQLISLAGDSAWEIPVLQSVATKGDGVEELLQAINSHTKFTETHPSTLERLHGRRLHAWIDQCLAEYQSELMSRIDTGDLQLARKEVEAGILSPFEAAGKVKNG